jgi:hypothetical protein
MIRDTFDSVADFVMFYLSEEESIFNLSVLYCVRRNRPHKFKIDATIKVTSIDPLVPKVRISSECLICICSVHP